MCRISVMCTMRPSTCTLVLKKPGRPKAPFFWGMPGQRKTIPREAAGNSWGGRDLRLSQLILWIMRPSPQLHQESGLSRDGLRSTGRGGVTYPLQELPQFVLASKERMVSGTTVQERTEA